MSIWFWNFGNPSTDFEWVWFCLCNVDDFSTTGTYLRASYGLPWCSDGKESACNARDLGSILGSGRSLGEGNGNLVQYSCLENPMYRGAWWATVHGVAKSRTWLRDWRFHFHIKSYTFQKKFPKYDKFDWVSQTKWFGQHWPIGTEKAMAPHSSTLAWKIPWMEEPGRLQSMGSLKVRHDWATSHSLFTFMHRRRQWQPTPVFLPGESQGRGSLVGCHLWGRTESDTTEVT